MPSQYVSDESCGMNGMFFVPYLREVFRCVVSDGGGWEHVSVSLSHRCPIWPEMCFIKGVFWDDEECVIQYHPVKSEYVNNHPFCLHLWILSRARYREALRGKYIYAKKCFQITQS